MTTSVRSPRVNALAAYIILYAALYCAFGVSSPFWPKFFELRGLAPPQIGLLLSLGMLTRLFAGPIVGRLADLWGSLRGVLALCSVFAAAGAVALVSTNSFLKLAVLNVLQSAALAPTTSIADALAIRDANAGEGRQGFEYGWVRGSASAAFVVGTLVAGRLLTSLPISTLIWIDALLLLGSAAATPLLPQSRLDGVYEATLVSSSWAGVLELLRAPTYLWVVAIAALVYGSHAIHDAFAVIRWSDAGIGPIAISVLWSEAVVAEVAVFFWIGPRLINLIGANAAASVSAGLGLLRWTVEGATTSVVALAIIQPLHGFTFALLHLVCVRVMAAVVPVNLAATGQSFYALGSGLATTLLTLLSGALFAKFGGASFYAMAALCALALPLAWLKIRL